MVATVVAYINGRIPVIVGVGGNATATTITAAQQLEILGVDGFLIICPYYNKPTQEGIYQHFIQLADAVSTPIIMYNHPGRTGVDMLPETVARLASHDNIVALKEAVVDAARFAALATISNDKFVLYSGDDASCLQLLAAGGKGLISVAANIIPAQMCAMVQAAIDDNIVLANDLQQALKPIFTVLNIESNPIPLKWALAQMGYIENVLCLPLTSLTKANETAVAETLVAMGLIKKDNKNVKIA
jgi:4-hydroxy-tetrahydrodipicolinate synthase